MADGSLSQGALPRRRGGARDPSFRRLLAHVAQRSRHAALRKRSWGKSRARRLGAGKRFQPATHWFHQHFNTGPEPALQLALRCGSHKFPLGIRVAAIRAGVYTSVKQGGTLIEYADEDPEVRPRSELELEQKGIAPDMNNA